MNSFIQQVFNKISLERDPNLWQSENDLLMPKRIKFLSEFEDTQFSSQLFNEKNVSKGLRKNAVLCNAFKKKSGDVSSDEDQEKKLGLLNQALCFSEVPEKGSEEYEYSNNIYVQLILERISILLALKCLKEASEDLDVLEDYYDEAALSIDYYSRFYKSKLHLILSRSCTSEKKASTYMQQYQELNETKNYKEVKKLVRHLEKENPWKENLPIQIDQGNFWYSFLSVFRLDYKKNAND